MFRYLAHRLLETLPVLAGVCAATFLLIHLVPGDPVDLLLGEQAAKQDRDNLRHELGLDQSLARQFVQYVAGIAHGNLGVSMQTREPISSAIAARFPATAELTLTAMLMALLWGLPWGAWAGARPRSACDKSSVLTSVFAMSLPGVFLGPLLIYVFAVRFDLFPVSERGGFDHLVLPSLSLAIPLGAVILRITRASMAEVISDDYIRTARSKGLSERAIYFRHGLRNALIPVITIVGMQTGAILTGTVITETVFDWPGLGSLLYEGIQRRDYPLVQGCVLLIAVIYVLVNLLTDIAYGFVNPKVRLT